MPNFFFSFVSILCLSQRFSVDLNSQPLEEAAADRGLLLRHPSVSPRAFNRRKYSSGSIFFYFRLSV